jgi:Dolichol-phosphate mannosyltransferase subunit 3 (DPM3)
MEVIARCLAARDELLEVFLALPGFVIVAFCCYSLAVIGYNLSVFPECPKAEKDLLTDIQRAKAGLSKNGFILQT